MELKKELESRAQKINATIVLPEANLDKRVYSACQKILKKNLAKIIVFGKLKDFGEEFKTPNCQIIDISKFKKLNEFANQLYELRKNKGLTLADAQKLIKEPTYYAMMLLKNNLADGVVAGAYYSTADTLRPALQIIKTKPEKSIVTGAMLMLKQGKKPLVFADVSLVENPTSENLADIAISAAEFYKTLTRKTPKVALLSYSTKGSAKGELVDKVARATKLAQAKSNFHIDGEMQVDAALNKTVAAKKGVSSEVGGNANVLVFPDLNAGNIAYKLVARLGGYSAIGPIMLNFNKPVNDLSRGCTVDEIVDTVIITKLLINN